MLLSDAVPRGLLCFPIHRGTGDGQIDLSLEARSTSRCSSSQPYGSAT
jgi:hypothetical protein